MFREKEPADGCDRDEQSTEVGQNALDALDVEVLVAEGVVQHASEDNAGDQVARDDEKNVNAKKAAWKQVRKGVIDEDGQNGNGTKACDVFSPVMKIGLLG